MTGCVSSRQALRSEQELRTMQKAVTETRDSVIIELRDTVKEVTTITVRENEVGDTIRMTMVTDRTRTSDRDAIARNSQRSEVVRDTVFVVKRDSLFVKNANLANPPNKASPVVSSLKWIFWVILALIGLKISHFLWR